MTSRLGIPTPPGDWVSDALCAEVDPELFFPDKGEGAKTIAAIRVCKGCKVWAQCLQYATDNDITEGVWGGMSSRDRMRMKWARHRADRKAS